MSIDRAVLLPDESLAWAEEEDAHKRTMSSNSEVVIHPRDPSNGQISATPSTNALWRTRSASLGAPGPSVHNEEGAKPPEQAV